MLQRQQQQQRKRQRQRQRQLIQAGRNRILQRTHLPLLTWIELQLHIHDRMRMWMWMDGMSMRMRMRMRQSAKALCGNIWRVCFKCNCISFPGFCGMSLNVCVCVGVCVWVCDTHK